MNVFVYTTIIVLIIFYIGKSPVDPNNLATERCIIRDTNAMFFLLGTVILAFVTGQRFAYGDTLAYLGYFGNCDTFSNVLSQFTLNSESLFKVYMSFIHTYISQNPRVFIEITSFITIFPIMYFYYNYSGDLKLAFYLFVMSGCWDHTMNGLRQYLASSILLFAFTALIKRKWYLYLPIVFIAAQIHTSAYIFVLIYFIANTKAFGKTTKVILFVGIMVVISSPLTGNLVSNLVDSTEYGEKYNGNEWKNGVNIFRILVMAVPIVLAYINREKIEYKYKYYNFVFNMSLMCLIFTLSGVFSAVYARFNLYFEIFNVVLLVWNINEFNNKKEYSWLKPTACICYMLYFIYQIMFVYSISWHEDYLFFVDNWYTKSWI